MFSDNSVYLSYARGADQTLIIRLIDVAASDEIFQCGDNDAGEVKERHPVDVSIIIDEEHLNFGESIKEFMDEIATSRRALFVISDEYLRSPYCMYECVSAYNAINPLKPKAGVKPFYPAAVFVEHGKAKDDAILVFRNGCPCISIDRYKAYWQRRLQDCPGDSDASHWFKKYIDMIGELECWFIGRSFLGSSDSLFSVFSVKNQCEDSQIEKYIQHAQNPRENKHPLPSSDHLLESTTTAFCKLLKEQPNFSKKFKNGDEFGTNDARCSFVTDVLRGDVYDFVSGDLVRILHEAASSNLQQRNYIRENVEHVFGLVVKHCIDRKSLHHRLQEMNQNPDGLPFAVSEEAHLPEMVTSSITGRPAAFRKVSYEADGDYDYVGQKEMVIDGNDYLESKQQIVDAKAERIYSLFFDEYNPAGERLPGQRKPGREILNYSVRKKLKEDITNSFFIKIEGLSEEDANKLAKDLNLKDSLENVPVFIYVSGQENVVKMDFKWHESLVNYWKAQERLAE